MKNHSSYKKQAGNAGGGFLIVVFGLMLASSIFAYVGWINGGFGGSKKAGHAAPTINLNSEETTEPVVSQPAPIETPVPIAPQVTKPAVKAMIDNALAAKHEQLKQQKAAAYKKQQQAYLAQQQQLRKQQQQAQAAYNRQQQHNQQNGYRYP